jgi:sugar phosphate permease
MATAQTLHTIAIGLILIAVVCFLLAPVLGAALIVIGLAIETIGYFVYGAQFWTGRKSTEVSGENDLQ